MRIARFHSRIEQFGLQPRADRIERRARAADSCQLDESTAYAKLLARTKLPPVQAGSRKVLAKCTRKKRVPALLQLFDHFGADDQQGLFQSAVNFRMSARVSFNSEGRYNRFLDRILGKTAW